MRFYNRVRFTTKSYNALYASRIYTVGTLCLLSQNYLLKLRSIGESACNDIVTQVHNFGLRFADEVVVVSEDVSDIVRKMRRLKWLDDREKELLMELESIHIERSEIHFQLSKEDVSSKEYVRSRKR